MGGEAALEGSAARHAPSPQSAAAVSSAPRSATPSPSVAVPEPAAVPDAPRDATPLPSVPEPATAVGMHQPEGDIEGLEAVSAAAAGAAAVHPLGAAVQPFGAASQPLGSAAEERVAAVRGGADLQAEGGDTPDDALVKEQPGRVDGVRAEGGAAAAADPPGAEVQVTAAEEGEAFAGAWHAAVLQHAGALGQEEEEEGALGE